MVGQRKETVLGRGANVRCPVARNADGERGIVIQSREQIGRLSLGARNLRKREEIESIWPRNLLDLLAHFDDLDRAGLRLCLDPPPLRRGIGIILAIDIGHQHRVGGFVDD